MSFFYKQIQATESTSLHVQCAVCYEKHTHFCCLPITLGTLHAQCAVCYEKHTHFCCLPQLLEPYMHNVQCVMKNIHTFAVCHNYWNPTCTMCSVLWKTYTLLLSATTLGTRNFAVATASYNSRSGRIRESALSARHSKHTRHSKCHSWVELSVHSTVTICASRPTLDPLAAAISR